MTHEKYRFNCAIGCLLYVLAIAASLFLLFACKPAERVVYQSRTDSVYVAKTDTFTRLVEVVRTDTVRTADSIYLREYVTVKVDEKGDTVWRDRVVWRDRWRDAVSTSVQAVAASEKEKAAQVLTEIKTDTVFVKETAKNKSSSKGETFAIVFAALALCLFIVWLTRKPKSEQK